MTGDVVSDARQQFTLTQQPSVGLDFEGQGVNQWAKLTREVAQKGNAIAIALDGNVAYKRIMAYDSNIAYER